MQVIHETEMCHPKQKLEFNVLLLKVQLHLQLVHRIEV